MATPASAAAALKDEGNAHMQSGAFTDAITAYTRALEALSEEERPSLAHVLYSNRSAALLSRGAPGDALNALTDANASVRACGGAWARSHVRKVNALLALSQFEDAIAAASAGLRVDASNSALREGLTAAQSRLSAQYATQAAAMHGPREVEAAQVDPLLEFMSEISSLSAAAGVKRPRQGEGEEVPSAGQEEEEQEDDAGAAAAAAAVSSSVSTLAPVERAALAEQSARLASEDLGPGAAHVERLTGPRSKWLNMNPFEVLQLPHTVSDDDVKARFKRLSALVHPDKHVGPNSEKASTAFQVVKAACDTLLDAARRTVLNATVVAAIKAGRKAWRDGGRTGSVDDCITNAVRRAFAEQHQRRIGYEHRIKAEAKREAEMEAAEVEAIEESRKAEAEWAKGSQSRMSSWVSFGATKKPRMGEAGLRLNDAAKYGAAAVAKADKDAAYKMKWR